MVNIHLYWLQMIFNTLFILHNIQWSIAKYWIEFVISPQFVTLKSRRFDFFTFDSRTEQCDLTANCFYLHPVWRAFTLQRIEQIFRIRKKQHTHKCVNICFFLSSFLLKYLECLDFNPIRRHWRWHFMLIFISCKMDTYH